jgi:hypothetical protein
VSALDGWNAFSACGRVALPRDRLSWLERTLMLSPTINQETLWAGALFDHFHLRTVPRRFGNGALETGHAGRPQRIPPRRSRTDARPRARANGER